MTTATRQQPSAPVTPPRPSTRVYRYQILTGPWTGSKLPADQPAQIFASRAEAKAHVLALLQAMPPGSYAKANRQGFPYMLVSPNRDDDARWIDLIVTSHEPAQPSLLQRLIAQLRGR